MNVSTKPAVEANPLKEDVESRDCAASQSAVGPEALGLTELWWHRDHLLTTADFFKGLRALAALHQRNTNLLLQELRRMYQEDATLAQGVSDLESAFASYASAHNTYEASLLSEVAGLKATVQPDTDPALTDAYNRIEAIVSSMQSSTAAVLNAAAPPPSSPGDSTVPGPSQATQPSSTSAATSSPSDGSNGLVSQSPQTSSSTPSPSSSPATTTEVVPEPEG
jgi:hypothetical protein